ncbi:hypothetical protein GALMADRAFT_1030059 [Galerina marginata CBS 339.88]|uniref:Uncharacterized protein n=1 Tax=Galerina marginata (strain CBS 339.88) TaxID=685588 RepID=A0A067SCW9_GALM3|nr:hypothetical protein GALMADRAFT_1030059 [Galerina marginata CBS 339.88]
MGIGHSSHRRLACNLAAETTLSWPCSEALPGCPLPGEELAVSKPPFRIYSAMHSDNKTHHNLLQHYPLSLPDFVKLSEACSLHLLPVDVDVKLVESTPFLTYRAFVAILAQIKSNGSVWPSKLQSKAGPCWNRSSVENGNPSAHNGPERCPENLTASILA